MTPADRLRSLVKEATRSYPTDGPDYQRGVRSREWLNTMAPQLAVLVADMAEALIPARDLLTVEVERTGDGGFVAVVQVIDEALARRAALFPEDSSDES